MPRGWFLFEGDGFQRRMGRWLSTVYVRSWAGFSALVSFNTILKSWYGHSHFMDKHMGV